MLPESTPSQVVHLEQRLHIFWEVPFQKWFLEHPTLLHWINRTYSFIHIPGTILFLVVLHYLTTTRKRRVLAGRVQTDNIAAGPALYEARRRTHGHVQPARLCCIHPLAVHASEIAE